MEEFKQGDYVTSDGQLYVYERPCTRKGEPPRVYQRKSGQMAATASCVYAIVHLPDGTRPIKLHRASLRAATKQDLAKRDVANLVRDVAPVRAAEHRAVAARQSEGASTPPPLLLSDALLRHVEAEVLEAYANRLEQLAQQLRTQAASLRT